MRLATFGTQFADFLKSFALRVARVHSAAERGPAASDAAMIVTPKTAHLEAEATTRNVKRAS